MKKIIQVNNKLQESTRNKKIFLFLPSFPPLKMEVISNKVK